MFFKKDALKNFAILRIKVYESWYITYLATSDSKRETTNERTCAFCLPTN